MDSAIPVSGQQGQPTAPSAPAAAWHGTFSPTVHSSPSPGGRERFRQSLPRVYRQPGSRAAWGSAWRQCEYAGLGFVLAIPAFAFIVVAVTVGLAVSLSLGGMLIGLPLLVLCLLGARQLGSVNRRLAGRLLGVRVGPPPALRPHHGRLGRARAVLADPVGWRACAYLMIKLPLSLLTMIIAVQVVAYGLPYLTFPVWWGILHANHVVIGVPGWLLWWKPDPLLAANGVHSLAVSFALVPVGVAALLWAPWATKGANAVDGRLIGRLLGPPLGHRMRELEQTRARAVDDSAARLRRIERDLHDGAQAQMVAVAMKLGLAREKLGGRVAGIAEADMERALELVDAAHRSAKEAIIELRDLARGIHPPVLDQGLGTALATLAARSDVPVELVIELPERPSAAIETIAYFCVAELLTNVAKHSGAHRATLEVVHVPGLLRVLVSDDGSGGARIEARGGLAGLAERVKTVDGRLQVSSPPHGPTVVTVELPSHA